MITSATINRLLPKVTGLANSEDLFKSSQEVYDEINPSETIPQETVNNRSKISINSVTKAAEATRNTSFTENFGKWWAATPSLQQNLMSYSLANSEDPEEEFTVINFRNEEGNFELTKRTPKEAYGDDFYTLSDDDKGKRIKDKAKEYVAEKYGNVSARSLPGMAGAASGVIGGATLGDPLTLAIPAGGSVKAAASIGALYGAGDLALETKLSDGSISYEAVALGTLVGGLGGALLYKGSDVLKDFIAGKAVARERVTESALRDAAQEAGVRASDIPDDLTKAAEQINSALGLNKNAAVKAVRDEFGGLGDAIPKRSPDDVLRTIEQINKAYGASLTKKDKQFLSTVEKTYKGIKRGKPRLITKPSKTGKLVVSRTRDSKRSVQIQEQAIQQAERDLGDAIEKSTRDLSDVLPKNVESDTVSQAVVDNMGLAGVNGKTSLSTVNRGIKNLDFNIDSNLGNDLYPRIGTLQDIGSILDNPKSFTNYKIGAINSIATSPETLVSRMGAAGPELNRRLNLYKAEKGTVLSQTFAKLQRDLAQSKMGRSLPKEINDELRSVLNGDIPLRNASPEIAKAARTYRKVLNNTVRDMVRSGNITKESGKTLLSNAAKNGYFPRIIDFDFLDTPKGKAKFNEVITSGELTSGEVNQLMSLFNVAKRKEKIKGMTKLPNGKYKISEDLAREFYQNRRATVDNATSAHFDFARKLDLDDDILKDFLVTDVNYAMQQYIDNSYSVALQSKYFGKGSGIDTPIANSLLDKIGQEYGSASQKEAREMFLRIMKDPRSEVTQKWQALQDWEANTINAARSWQSLKLVMQPIINIPQAVTNSHIALGGDVGLARSAWLAWKGTMKSTFSKEHREWAAHSGATSQSILMQIMGEHGGSMSNLSTRVLKGVGVPLAEEWVRRWSAGIGRAMVEYKENAIKQITAKRDAGEFLGPAEQKKLKELQEDLLELGIAPQDIGNISAQQMNIAGTLFSNNVNFVPDAMAIPRSLQGPWQSLVRQFKTFIFMQTRLMKNVVAKAQKRNGVTGAVKALAAIASAPIVTLGYPYFADQFRAQVRGTITGKSDKELENFLFGKYEDMSLLDKYLVSISTIGALGFHGEFVADALRTSPESAIMSLGGPTVADLTKVLTGAASTTKRFAEREDAPLEPLIKKSLTTLPLGAQIRDLSFPESSATSYKDVYQGLLNGR